MGRVEDGYIATYTGKLIKPLDPDPDLINALDIAHHLSNQCRFSGAVREFYSVGEHVSRVHDIVSEENRLWALLHDASEAFISDIPAPVKTQEEMDFYKIAEKRIMNAVCVKFNLSFEEPEEVHKADKILLATELRDLMPPETYYINGYKPLKNRINPWTPVIAKSEVIERLEKLGIEVKR